MLNTIRGFKDFVMRGNVIDLSVGIVIGAAFTALVGKFTDAFIKPLLELFHTNGTEQGGSFTINGSTFEWSLFVNGVVTFLITAAVLYFLVVTPMNKLAERGRKGVEPESMAPSEEILLLREIRDALRAGAPMPAKAAALAGPSAGAPAPRPGDGATNGSATGNQAGSRTSSSTPARSGAQSTSGTPRKTAPARKSR